VTDDRACSTARSIAARDRSGSPPDRSAAAPASSTIILPLEVRANI
jgi:hypothetical protein